MGGKESKQSCLSYEDAVKRVSDSELRRLKDAFKKSAGVGRLYLSRNAFQQDVLFEGVPPHITELLYTACGGTTKGISFKDLICGLVLLTRGTEEEKIRFLWALHCSDVPKTEYVKTVNVNRLDTVTLYSQNDRVNFDQFREWIVNNKNSTVLSKWLLSDSCISLTSELETPTFYQSLAGVTHLEEKDIGDLEKEFWRLKNSSPNGQLDLQLLGPLISPPIPKNALVGLFNAFDENRDGHIDFKELCCGVSAACRGPVVERTRFCFKIFDIDRDGVLSHEETLLMVGVLLFVAKENRNANIYNEVMRQDVINDLMVFIDRKREQGFKAPREPGTMTADNLSLTAEDFMMWSVESDLKLVQPFLDLTFEVCHIVFGLWPQCRHMEYDIVRGWLKREEKRQYRVGQFWYLISHDWWLSWIQYTQNNAIPCSYCKKTTNNAAAQRSISGVDEALVCDESFNSSHAIEATTAETTVSEDNYSLSSHSSAVSSGQYAGLRPGPIDNTVLITPNPYKNVRTLTGEGGHLKRDTPLVQNHDFELLPKSLWKALNRWYGDSLPLPRQVIQPPDSTEVELELYPLNLRILLNQCQPNAPSVNNWGAVSGGYSVMASGGGYAAITATNVMQPPKRYLAYTAAFSRLATVRQIGDFLCEQLRLKSENIRLWHIPAGSLENSAILLEEEYMTLKELLIKDNDQILLEIRNRDLTWPEELGSLTLNQGAASGERRFTRSSIMSVHVPGATGLHNLGNTCFMNAALQVLFNTQPLAQYFYRSLHMYELNRENKLGTRGQLATRYGELLEEVRTATTRSVAPLRLRFCVTKHAPQFAGGGQHDSQELLEWFLDALHEDLNRVMEKPYSELKDSNGRPDKVVAAEAWAQHHARNQSIIIDLFYGQLKSKVSCLCCGRESVRFDPFSLLSLPLPVENYVYFEVLVILLDGSVPVKYGVRLNSESKYADLKRALSLLCLLNPNFMLVCEIWNAQIKQILPDEQKIKSSTAKELYVYQLPEENSDRSRSSSILGVNIEKGLKDIQRSSALISGQDSNISLNIHNNQNQSLQMPNCTQVKSSSPAMIEDALQTHYSKYVNVNGVAVGTGDVDGDNGSADCDYEDNDNDNEHEHVTTKHSPDISRSPENTFVTDVHKRVSSTKLLYAESNTCSSSITNNSGENSLETSTIESMSVDPSPLCASTSDRRRLSDTCPCRFNSADRCTQPVGSGDDSDDIDAGRCFRNNVINQELQENNHNSGNGNGVGLFSRMPSQQYKVGKYLIAVHRKITRHDSYFLSYHKTRPSLFGVPLLIPSTDGTTCKDLYCAVWLQVSRLLSPLPTATDQANHAADCDDSLGYDFPFTLRAVKSDGLTCAFCAWSNFCRGCEIPCNNDFLQQNSILCGAGNASNSSTPKLTDKFSSLPNLEMKRLPECNTSLPVNTTSSKWCDDFTIAIDWDPTALHLRYQSTLERLWSDHESISQCRKEQIEPVDLNHCLRAFTSEEKLEQWYHCSHCKGKKPATKKLQIWKLPPILIVHLKRFNCVNGKWVKSQKVVHFPFDDFDPTPYLASVPQETILRHKELLELKMIEEGNDESEANDEIIQEEEANMQLKTKCNEMRTNNSNGNHANNNVNKSVTPTSGKSVDNVIEMRNLGNAQNHSMVFDDCRNIVNASNQAGGDATLQVDGKCEEHMLDNATAMCSTLNRKEAAARVERRKRLISSSLTKTPIVDGEFEDYHQHKLQDGADKFDPKYKLYAVVSHSGMLSGGHYISYATNANGSWYCYNDSSCREIPSQPNIDPSSAYLLFYERKGLDYEPYFPDVKDKMLPNGNLALEMDESDNDLKKLCVIS